MYKIKLNTISDVKNFIKEAINIEHIDIFIRQGRYIVDGKSIMGIFSLNLLEELDMEIVGLNVDIQVFINQLRNLGIKVRE